MLSMTPKTILDLSRNFMESRILLTGAELGLFDLLASKPLSAEELAAKIKGNLRALTIILDALAAQNITVEKRMVLLSEPIKQLGTYKVPIRVYKGVEPEITVEIAPEA